MPQGPGTYGSQVGRPTKKTSVGLSKAGGDFAVGRKQAKELKKKKRKNKKKSTLSLRQKILKALKITAKGAGGAAAIAGELAVPDKAGAPTLPQGYHSWSPRKKSQYVNSLRRK